MLNENKKNKSKCSGLCVGQTQPAYNQCSVYCEVMKENRAEIIYILTLFHLFDIHTMQNLLTETDDTLTIEKFYRPVL